jgi:hypothetical protein
MGWFSSKDDNTVKLNLSINEECYKVVGELDCYDVEKDYGHELHIEFRSSGMPLYGYTLYKSTGTSHYRRIASSKEINTLFKKANSIYRI